MKKVISLLLVVVMCLLLCACGSSGACTCDCPQCALCEQKTHTQETAENDGNKIEFPAPVCLVESNDVKVELTGFHQKVFTINEVTTTRKYVALKIHNKVDYEIILDLKNLAVNDEQVNHVHQQPTQSPRVLAGDTTTYFIEIKPVFEDALNSMEDLYQLKGMVKIGQYGTHQGYDAYYNAYEIPFSVPEAIAKNHT